MENTIWGWTEPGNQVTVSMNGKTATATTNQSGKWLAKLGPFQAGGPYGTSPSPAPSRSSSPTSWSATSGSAPASPTWRFQFEMATPAITEESTLRPITRTSASSPCPRKSLRARTRLRRGAASRTKPNGWIRTTAVLPRWGLGWFLGRRLLSSAATSEKLNVPIGLIHTSWGGTTVRSFGNRTKSCKPMRI